MHGFAFLSSLLISVENREGYSQRAVCFSLIFTPGIPLKRGDRSLQGSPARETFSLFTFRCFFLLLFISCWSLFTTTQKKAHLEPRNVRSFSVNTLIYTITNTQPCSFNNNWMHETTNATSSWKARSLCLWKGFSEMRIIRSTSVSCIDSVHHQNRVCIYSKKKRPLFSCWPALCKVCAGLPA